MNTNPTETARELLWRHGLPEDVIDGALCLHAQELAAVQRREADDLHQTEPGVVRGLRVGADLIDPTRGAPAVVSSPPDTTTHRDRVAEALYTHSHPGWGLQYADLDRDQRDTYLARADAVLAVLPPTARATGLTEAADFVRDLPMTRTLHTTTSLEAGLRRLAAEAQQPETEQRCTCGGTFPIRHLHADAHAPAAGVRQQPDTETQAVPCSAATLRHPHAAHEWQPQPGMDFIHCPGASGWEAPCCISPKQEAPSAQARFADEASGTETPAVVSQPGKET